MQYYVKEWADNRVSLIAEDGYVLADFYTVAEAVVTCVKECLVWPQRVERHHKSDRHNLHASEFITLNFAS